MTTYFDVYDISQSPTSNYAYIEQSSNRSLARASNGDLYAVYNAYNPTTTYYSIRISRSTDGGVTWTQYELFSYASNSSFTPKVAVDSNDKIWVVWEGYGATNNPTKKNIHLISGTWGNWGSKVDITDDSVESYVPGIAIDDNDDVHLVWYGYDSSITNSGVFQVRYVKVLNNGTVGTITTLTDRSTNQFNPAIAVDSSGDLHVVWEGVYTGSGSGAETIQYLKQTSGVWGSVEFAAVQSSPQQGLQAPAISIDSIGQPHISYVNYTASEYFYTYKTTSWQTPVLLESSGSDFSYNTVIYSSIAHDSEDTVHVVYLKQQTANKSTIVRYMKKPAGGSWTTPVTINYTSFNPNLTEFQEQPTLMWAQFPKFGGIGSNIPKTGSIGIWCDSNSTSGPNYSANILGFYTDDYVFDENISVSDSISASESTIISKSGPVTNLNFSVSDSISPAESVSEIIANKILLLDGSGTPPDTGMRYGMKIYP